MAETRVFKITDGCQTREELNLQLQEIRALKSALISSSLATITAGNTYEYELDTGQTRQRVRYRTMKEITDAIQYFRVLENDILSKLRGGRVSRLVNYKNFPPGGRRN